MEASSSSAPPIRLGYDYEVFLSFRGEDTRRTFTDHLYTDLVDKGIHTFRDDEELPKGEEIKSELLKAINQSKVSIPVFSKCYASSKWCLMELAQMVKCMKAGNQKIFPIFYHVEPHEVRHRKREYAEAFAEHQEKHPSTVVEEWKTALKTVGELKGWHLNDDGYEGSLRSELVLEVFKELKKYQHVDITDNVVGIDDHVDEIMDLLDIDIPDVKIGGIWGMAGSGKTTIAKFMYNQLMHKFDYCSFLGDISDTSKSKGMEILQSQLVSDILGRQGEKLFDVGKGKDVLRDRFYKRKVLIVLDDVDQADQLNTLVRLSIGSVAAGSRIIITTRNRNVLEGKVDWLYEVKEMEEEDALLLFCKHAFKQSFALPEYDDLSREFVKAIGGIPLAIEVVASYLSNKLKDKDAWEEELRRLKREPNIQAKLRVGTKSLNHEERETYLDIACLFHGMDRRIPVPMWEAQDLYPVRTINDLLAKSLIKVTDGNKLCMHKLLRDLGKEDVRAENLKKPGERSRLWCSEDGVEVLDNEEGTEKVQAICLARDPELEQRRFTDQDFRKLSHLLFLDLGYANLNGGFERCLRRLKWISWHGVGQTQLSIPSELHLKKLVVLDLSESSIGEDWGGWNSIQRAEKLEVLNLKSCQQLRSTPRFNSFLPIKRLILEDCSELSLVHPSIGQLTALESLNLKKCRSVEILPNVLGSLVGLTELVIDEAPIKRLPKMENLETLSAKSCRSLSTFPELQLDDCESLKELNLSHTPVVEFCYSARKLRNLQVLDISCSLAKCFPPSLEELQKLEVINASGCQSLEGEVLPANLGRLTSLRILRLDNTRITSIPGSIRGLRHLEVLDLGSTKCEEPLPELPSSLINLRVTCRSSMTVLPNLSDLINLKELEFLECSELAQFPKEFKSLSKLRRLKFHSTSIVAFPVEVGELCQLRELNVSDCDKLESLPELPSGLRRLLISGCSSFRILPKLSSLEKLGMFTLMDCPNVVEIPNLGELKSMRTLRIRGPLATIHGLEMLSSLVYLSLVECLMGNSIDLSKLKGVSNLEVAFCGRLQKIEGLRSLGGLKRLKIMNCETLEEVEGIQELESIEEWICQCPALRNFPDLSTMKKLRILNFASCNSVKTLPNLSFVRNLKALNLQILENLVEVDSLVGLVSLETLVISRCTGIETIPNLSMLQQLKTLQLHGLERIVEIPGLDELLSLEMLVVSGCNAIETLPSLSRLQNLKTLKLRGLEKVEEILGLSGLVSLESLAISHCAAIMALPGLSMNLRELALYSCRQLSDIPRIDELESLVILKCEQIDILTYIPMLRKLKTLELELQRYDVEILGIYELQSLERLAIYSEYMPDSQFGGLGMGRNLKKLELFLHGSLPVDDVVRDFSLWSPPQVQLIVWPNEINGLVQLLTHQEFTALELQSPHLSVESIQTSIGETVNLDNVIVCKTTTHLLELKVQKLINLLGLKKSESSLLSTILKSPTLHRIKTINCKHLEDYRGLSEIGLVEELRIEDCDALEALPNLSRLQKLKGLVLHSCRRLKDIEGLNELECLEELRVENCGALEALPNLARLQKLKILVLRSCGRFEDIQGFGGLEWLEELSVEQCDALWKLPNLSRLQKLKRLVLRSCGLLKDIRGLCKLEWLEELRVEDCHAFEMGELCQLRELNISDCDKLESLPELPSGLRRLLISRCSSLRILPKLSSLEKLGMFTLLDCPNVVEIPNLGELKSMRTLMIRGPLATIHGLEMLSSLVDLSLVECLMGNSIDLSKLERVSNLEVAFCGKLQKIEGLRSLGGLKRLKIMNCETLEEVEGIQELESIEELWICQCPALRNFPDLSTMKKLRILNLASCNSVKTLPNLSFMRNLKALNLQILENLMEVDSLVGLVSLETLVISRCTGIETIPNLSMLQQLKTLQLHGLERIVEIPGLDELFSLEMLVVSGCNAIETLPSLSRLQNLKTLKLRGLEKVEEILGLSGLVSLESLAISHCAAIMALPGLSKNLRELTLYSCRQLSDIPGIGELVTLESLVILKCEQIDILRDIPKLWKLKTLELELQWHHVEILGIYGLQSLERLAIYFEYRTDSEFQRLLMKCLQMTRNFERVELFLHVSLPADNVVRDLRGWPPQAQLIVLPNEINGLVQLLTHQEFTALELQCPHLSVESIQTSIGEMVNLDYVIVCKTTTHLLELKVQKLINLLGLKKSESSLLSTILKSPTLQRIKTINCKHLEDYRGLSEIGLVEELRFEQCDALEALPNLSRQKLKRLVLCSCGQLKDILELSGLESLEELNIENCNSLEALPDLTRLRKLKRLVLCSCQLKDIPGLSGLESLDIENCNSLEAFPNLARLQKLKRLVLCSCGQLKDILGLSGLESLEELRIEQCYALEALPNLSRLQKLKGLVLCSCRQLKDIRGLCKLECLEELRVEGWYALEALPDLARFQKLKRLVLCYCEQLPGLSGLESLEELRIQYCNSFDALPNLARLQNIKRLVLSSCGQLKVIPGLGELESLEELNINDCDSLEALPNLSRLQVLRKLRLRFCKQLKDPEGLMISENVEYFWIYGCPLLKDVHHPRAAVCDWQRLQQH